MSDDGVTSVGSGIDSAVLRISRTYEVRGYLQTVTSLDNPSPGSGAIVNDVRLEYNAFGQLINDYQSQTGAVSTNTTPKTSYTYEDGSRNSARRNATIYPNGRIIGYNYGPTSGTSDLLDRIEQIWDGSSALAQYTYRGRKSTVRIQYLEPVVEMTYIAQPGQPYGDGGDQYTGLDRFNRIVDVPWLITGTSNYLERVQYGFDRVSNRVWRKEVVAPSGNFDEQFAYDGLYQLDDRKRGTLGSGATIIGTPAEEEAFVFDATGNWQRYTVTVSGSQTLDQSRAHDKGNEISAIDGVASALEYNAGGSTTITPSVTNWRSSQIVTWDAWNRLVRVATESGTLGSYEFDGLMRRVIKITAVGGETQQRNYFYSDAWQILEERLGTSSSADRQFVWGLRYPDGDLIVRDWYGASTSRLYALHDQWHVTAVTDRTAAVQERYCYDAFGTSTVLTAAFQSRSASLYDWETRYCAYRFDAESSLYQVRQRSLHSGLGRWLSRDSLRYVTPYSPYGNLLRKFGGTRLFNDDAIELLQGPNLYIYVRNAPPQGTDPTGEFFPPVVIAIVAVVLIAALLTEATVGFKEQVMRDDPMAPPPPPPPDHTPEEEFEDEGENQNNGGQGPPPSATATSSAPA
ncbi:MAG: hypothetical protein WDN28_23400 [Chthoniobacter sp.]